MPATKTGAADMIMLHAMTSLHPGAGSALGTVDLPVQRERHTQWPLVPGSSLKGIMRDRMRANIAKDRNINLERADNDPGLMAIFGRPTRPLEEEGRKDNDKNDYSGALSLTDARLLAFPVRSLKGLFAYATCPAALERLKRDCEIAGVHSLRDKVGNLAGRLDDGRALTGSDELIISGASGSNMVLEEFDFQARTDPAVKALGEALDGALNNGTRLKSHLVVISDDSFTHFARYATEVNARIGLDYQTKTVKDGALFYQEFLPPETIFYTLALADTPWGKNNGHGLTNARAVLDALAGQFGDNNDILQIGGDATTGKGLCKVSFVNGGVK